MFGKFSLTKRDGCELVVYSSDHIIDAMSVEEFMGMLYLVARNADDYEREHGQDVF